MPRRRLGLKLFISYLIIILVGIVVLAASASLVIPTAFNRHMGNMMGGNMMGPGMMANNMSSDLYTSFHAAVNDALFKAGLAAFVAAILVSIIVSRQVVAPIQEMTTASQYIADGHYDQRVRVPGNLPEGDMDELAQLALSFNQMASKLAQTETMRRQLIADVSHELRTPLTAIKGSLEGLMDGVMPSTPETYQQIYREADRLQRLVADLQELSRVEAGNLLLKPKSASISQLVETVTSHLRPQFDEKGVALEVDIPRGLPMVFVDEDRIVQVMINLVGNALQYTPTGGQVFVTASKVENEIQVRVRDTGIGIPPEHLPHVFARFYRVEKSRSRAGGGSGIGLTIAKHLIEAHRGRIWAQSEGSGHGTTFTFSVPIAT